MIALPRRWCVLAGACLLAGCATDTLVVGEPRANEEQAIAPFEHHEECGVVNAGERIDFRFAATRPVHFELYYADGIARIAPLARDDVTQWSGVFPPPATRRYCLRWDAGREGAYVDFRIRILPAARP